MRVFNYKKYEDYKWDSEILRKISCISNNKGKLEVLLPQNKISFDKLSEISKFESIVSSNFIEGIVTTSHRFKMLINKNDLPKNKSEQEILGYKDVLITINQNYNYINITPNYILQLHNMMYKNVKDKSFGGKYKNSQNYINAKDENGNEYTLFTPLDVYKTPKAIEDICNEYNKAINNGVINPLIISFIFILDFLSIHPFNDGNGRMSRILTNLLLYKLNYFVGKYISIEKIITKTKDLYYDSLYASQKDWHNDKNDPTSFINYMLGIIEVAYNDLEDKINTSNSKLTAYDLVKESISKKIGKVTKSDIIEECPTLSASSIEKAISRLVNENILEKKGKGKNTFYIIKK